MNASIRVYSFIVSLCLFAATNAQAQASASKIYIVEDNQAPLSSDETTNSEAKLRFPMNQYGSSAQFGLSHTQNRWSHFSSALRNGGLGFDMNLGRRISPLLEGALGFHWQTASPNATDEENVGAFFVDLGLRGYFTKTQISPFAGLALGYGAYRVWTVHQETTSQITYNKHAEGSLLGLIPHIGLRVAFSPFTAVDVQISYRGFFDFPQSQIGGWNIMTSFAFLSY